MDVLHPIISLSGGLLFTALMFWWKALPVAWHMNHISDAMCSEPQDFVYTINDVGLIVTSSTDEKHERSTAVISSLMAEGDAKKVPDSDAGLFVDTLDDIRLWEGKTVPETVAEIYARFGGDGCADIVLTDAPALGANLRRVAQNDSLSSCTEALPYCDSVILSRVLCPQTCGCGAPKSGLWLSGQDEGCSEPCSKERHDIGLHKFTSCSDEAQAELQSSAAWQRLTKSLARSSDDFAIIAKDLMELGCNAIANVSATARSTLCDGDMHVGGVADFCPISCGCNKPDWNDNKCPFACDPFGDPWR